MMYKRSIVFLLMWLPALFAGAQKSALTGFPKGYTPEEVGRLIAYRMVYSKHALHAGKWIGYPETFSGPGPCIMHSSPRMRCCWAFREKV
ncbi:hypothetical protein [Niabella hibiscisoli]|uniref:hypothetical protein n=1 Tax=Niabella hibiscisoli TaxID=1825928 RepID=UPI001F0FDA64|nr:hypothetical protein [Niabella hibiscisoli]MCH5718541.1 hypothetical protein [Niabella hibiscisoli]